MRHQMREDVSISRKWNWFFIFYLFNKFLLVKLSFASYNLILNLIIFNIVCFKLSFDCENKILQEYRVNNYIEFYAYK